MPDLAQSVLKILDTSGKTVGTGFLISPSLCVTCAHVINAASLTSGRYVYVQLYSSSNRHLALILKDGFSPQEQYDVAFLALSSPLAGGISIPLAPAELIRPGTPFTSLGFPQSPVADV